MVRYNIRIKDVTTKFYFVHKDYQTLNEEQQSVEFDKAVKELERVYKTYGRFATEKAVDRQSN